MLIALWRVGLGWLETVALQLLQSFRPRWVYGPFAFADENLGFAGVDHHKIDL